MRFSIPQWWIQYYSGYVNTTVVISILQMWYQYRIWWCQYSIWWYQYNIGWVQHYIGEFNIASILRNVLGSIEPQHYQILLGSTWRCAIQAWGSICALTLAFAACVQDSIPNAMVGNIASVGASDNPSAAASWCHSTPTLPHILIALLVIAGVTMGLALLKLRCSASAAPKS